MMYTRPITNRDEEQLLAAGTKLQQIGVDVDQQGWHMPIVNHLNSNPSLPITVDNIVAFVNANKQLFQWTTATKREYDELAGNFTESQRNYIAAKLGLDGFEITDEDSLLTNFNVFVKAFSGRGYQPHQLNDRTFQLVLGNLISGQQGHKLIKKAAPSKYNAEAAKKAHDEAVEAAKKSPVQHDWTKSLNPEMRAHRESVQAAIAQAEQEKQQTLQTDAFGEAHWKGRVEQYLGSIRENVISEYLQQEFSKPKNGNWEFTWRVLDNTYNRIKNQGFAAYLKAQSEKN